jgi:hypothetical protein
VTALALIIGWWTVLGIVMSRNWCHEEQPRAQL